MTKKIIIQKNNNSNKIQKQQILYAFLNKIVVVIILKIVRIVNRQLKYKSQKFRLKIKCSFCLRCTSGTTVEINPVYSVYK